MPEIGYHPKQPIPTGILSEFVLIKDRSGLLVSLMCCLCRPRLIISLGLSVSVSSAACRRRSDSFLRAQAGLLEANIRFRSPNDTGWVFLFFENLG
ncbi:MAG: hypothetical protein OXC02_11540 [Rhodobacteraceae bacterium]|nr:hypothetical protein [Paracoccaceae bacterium]